MSKSKYKVLDSEKGLIKTWTENIPFEEQAKEQLRNIASLDFIFKHVAVMPDVHLGKGATVGSVVPTLDAVIPAAVGVDIGCGMMALKTQLKASDLPDDLAPMRSRIESLIPVGFAVNDKVHGGALLIWNQLKDEYKEIIDKYPEIEHKRPIKQLGTLGGGNHFIEVCLDTEDSVWVMLHSGSRGVGNIIGRFFIEKAKREMEKWFIHLPDKDLAYLPKGSKYFDDYVKAVNWAQKYAQFNRNLMMSRTIMAMEDILKRPIFETESAINCHHNYISLENHFGKNVYVTRKGAVRARKGDMGIIPGSMGAKSFIVEGRGNEESFCSCSHGAGRVMSRNQAKKLITLEEHKEATKGVECKKDESVIDESPKAYKNIDDVMAAQEDLISIKYTLKQILCIKG